MLFFQIFSVLMLLFFTNSVQAETPQKTGSDLTVEADKIVCERDTGECTGDGHVKVVKTSSSQNQQHKGHPTQTLTAEHMKVSFKKDHKSSASQNPASKDETASFKAIDKVSVKDNVTLREGTDVVKSDQAVLHVEEKKATFEGDVRIRKDAHYAKGASATYDHNRGMRLCGSRAKKAKAIIKPDMPSKTDDRSSKKSAAAA